MEPIEGTCLTVVGRNGNGRAAGGAPEAGDELAQVVRRLLVLLGEDPDREGLRDTPERVARSLRDLTRGYGTTAREAVGGALFPSGSSSGVVPSPVVLDAIPFHSLCEHHLLPFFGHVRVAYVPGDALVGLSKIVRVVDAFARRLQVQERLTGLIADALEEELGARGVAVGIEARHLCMEMRGVARPGVRTTTSAFRGLHLERPELRESFLRTVQSDRGIDR